MSRGVAQLSQILTVGLPADAYRRKDPNDAVHRDIVLGRAAAQLPGGLSLVVDMRGLSERLVSSAVACLGRLPGDAVYAFLDSLLSSGIRKIVCVWCSRDRLCPEVAWQQWVEQAALVRRFVSSADHRGELSVSRLAPNGGRAAVSTSAHSASGCPLGLQPCGPEVERAAVEALRERHGERVELVLSAGGAEAVARLSAAERLGGSCYVLSAEETLSLSPLVSGLVPLETLFSGSGAVGDFAATLKLVEPAVFAERLSARALQLSRERARYESSRGWAGRRWLEENMPLAPRLSSAGRLGHRLLADLACLCGGAEGTCETADEGGDDRSVRCAGHQSLYDARAAACTDGTPIRTLLLPFWASLGRFPPSPLLRVALFVAAGDVPLDPNGALDVDSRAFAARVFPRLAGHEQAEAAARYRSARERWAVDASGDVAGGGASTACGPAAAAPHADGGSRTTPPVRLPCGSPTPSPWLSAVLEPGLRRRVVRLCHSLVAEGDDPWSHLAALRSQAWELALFACGEGGGGEEGAGDSGGSGSGGSGSGGCGSGGGDEDGWGGVLTARCVGTVEVHEWRGGPHRPSIVCRHVRVFVPSRTRDETDVSDARRSRRRTVPLPLALLPFAATAAHPPEPPTLDPTPTHLSTPAAFEAATRAPDAPAASGEPGVRSPPAAEPSPSEPRGFVDAATVASVDARADDGEPTSSALPLAQVAEDGTRGQTSAGGSEELGESGALAAGGGAPSRSRAAREGVEAAAGVSEAVAMGAAAILERSAGVAATGVAATGVAATVVAATGVAATGVAAAAVAAVTGSRLAGDTAVGSAIGSAGGVAGGALAAGRAATSSRRRRAPKHRSGPLTGASASASGTHRLDVLSRYQTASVRRASSVPSGGDETSSTPRSEEDDAVGETLDFRAERQCSGGAARRVALLSDGDFTALLGEAASALQRRPGRDRGQLESGGKASGTRRELALRLLGCDAASARELDAVRTEGGRNGGSGSADRDDTLLVQMLALRLVPLGQLGDAAGPTPLRALLVATALQSSSGELAKPNLFAADHYEQLSAPVARLLSWFRVALQHVILVNDALRRPLRVRAGELCDGAVVHNTYRALTNQRALLHSARVHAACHRASVREMSVLARCLRMSSVLDAGGLPSHPSQPTFVAV